MAVNFLSIFIDIPLACGDHLRPERPGGVALNGRVTANSDLDEQQLFVDIPTVARVLGRDARTVRRCVESGEIPGQKFGARWSVPAAWVREQAGITEAATAATALDADTFANAVAARVTATLADEVITRLLARTAVGDGAEAGK